MLPAAQSASAFYSPLDPSPLTDSPFAKWFYSTRTLLGFGKEGRDKGRGGRPEPQKKGPEPNPSRDGRGFGYIIPYHGAGSGPLQNWIGVAHTLPHPAMHNKVTSRPAKGSCCLPPECNV